MASADSTAPLEPNGLLLSASVDVVSPEVAFVFVPVDASGHVVPSMWATTDQARTFRLVATPAGVGVAWPLIRLHFASAKVGLAILGDPGTGTQLVATTDGARSWRPVRLPGPGQVVQVAGHGSRLYALTADCSTRLGCAGARVYTATSPSGPWRRVFTGIPATAAGGTGLAAWGDSAWVTVGVGGPTPRVFHSTDAGVTDTAAVGPNCTVDTLVATSAKMVWMLCGTGMMVALLRQELGRPAVSLPVAGAGTGNTFLDPLTDRSVVFCTAVGDDAGLRLSTDGGARFVKVGAIPAVFTTGGHALDVLTFLTSRVGLAITDQTDLHRSTDGGESWQPVALPRG